MAIRHSLGRTLEELERKAGSALAECNATTRVLDLGENGRSVHECRGLLQ